MTVRDVLPRDAIPSVDDPSFGISTVCHQSDRVIVLDDNPPRAYPIRILHHHEIVNDRLHDRPVVITWCPLCGSAVAYDRRLGNRTLTLGVSGKLADDDLVMYDRETESEWKQSTGWAIAGVLSGHRLDPLPTSILTLEAFRDTHPDGVVLQPPGGESEAGQRGGEAVRIRYDADPYEAYFDSEGYGHDAHRGEGSAARNWSRDDLRPKDPIVGLEFGEEAIAVPVRRIRRNRGVLSVAHSDRSIVLIATTDAVAAYRDPGIRFQVKGDGTITGDGTEWDPRPGESDDGRRLQPVPFRYLFAFAWQADHGADTFLR